MEGVRLDIDEYYAQEQNQKKLKRINNSEFPDLINKNQRTL